MLSHGCGQIYKMSLDRNEYRRLQRTLTGKGGKNDFESDMVNDTVIEGVLHHLKDKDELYLIHDPRDIRKLHSDKLENLGKVRN